MRNNLNQKIKYSQPPGYYNQEIREPKCMTPRQRFMSAMGDRIILGQFFGVRNVRE